MAEELKRQSSMMSSFQKMTFLKKQKKSDSVFLVGRKPHMKKMYGDRGKVVELSDELDKELYETQLESHNQGKPYRFPNTTVEAFTEILKMAYGRLPDIMDSNYMDLWRFAFTYGLDKLFRDCAHHAREMVDPYNALRIWTSSFLMGDLSEDLELRCMEAIEKDAFEVLMSNYFTYTLPQMIHRMVFAPWFRVGEEKLFNRVEEWTHTFTQISFDPSPMKDDPDYAEVRWIHHTNRIRINIRMHKEKGKPGPPPRTPVKMGWNKNSDKKKAEMIKQKQKLLIKQMGPLFRHALMSSKFFIDRVLPTRCISHDISDEILIHHVDFETYFHQKQRPASPRFRLPRDMTREDGLTHGFEIIYANTELKNAKTLFNKDHNSRWAYKTIKRVCPQYFIVDLKFNTYPKIIKMKMGFDDIDCIKDIQLWAYKKKGLEEIGLDAKQDLSKNHWIASDTILVHQSKEWQVFKPQIDRELYTHTRFWAFSVTDTYGRYTCLSALHIGCFPKLSVVSIPPVEWYTSGANRKIMAKRKAKEAAEKKEAERLEKEGKEREKEERHLKRVKAREKKNGKKGGGSDKKGKGTRGSVSDGGGDDDDDDDDSSSWE